MPTFCDDIESSFCLTLVISGSSAPLLLSVTRELSKDVSSMNEPPPVRQYFLLSLFLPVVVFVSLHASFKFSCKVGSLFITTFDARFQDPHRENPSASSLPPVSPNQKPCASCLYWCFWMTDSAPPPGETRKLCCWACRNRQLGEFVFHYSDMRTSRKGLCL